MIMFVIYHVFREHVNLCSSLQEAVRSEKLLTRLIILYAVTVSYDRRALSCLIRILSRHPLYSCAML